MSKVFIGIDIGTTNVKVAAINEHGSLVGFYTKQTPLITIQENWVEQSPEAWWEATADCFDQMSKDPTVNTGDIEGIGVSAQGTGATFVDTSGQPLHNCLIWMDRRGEVIGKRHADFRDRVFELSGNEIDAVYNTLAAAWFKEYRPDVFAQTHKMLTATEFIIHKLSGVFSANRSDAGNQMSYDAKKETWSDEIMNRFGLSVDLLPQIHECTDIIGNVTKEAALALKIKSGIPVIAGGEDTSSAAFAMGVHKDGQTYYSSGTSTNLGVCVEDNLLGHPGIPNVMTLPHVVKGMRLKSGNITTSGSSTEWLKNVMYANEENPFAKMDEDVMNAAPGGGNLFFLPYLAGTFNPVSNSNARGSFIGISLSTKREDIARAVMEGVAFEVRNHCVHMAKHGHVIKELRGAGGPTKSDIWNQIISDISGVKLTLIKSNADASVGDAMLAAIATGGFSSYEDAVNRTVNPGKVYTPNPEMHEFYLKRFEIYMQIYDSLCPAFDEIAKLNEKRIRI